MLKFNAVPVMLIATCGVTLLELLGSSAALAQRGSDPNMGHFYMSRQQVTITDDTPIINNKMTPPPGPQQQAAGAMPAGLGQGLPAARWTQYSPAENPNLSTSLPKVSNGVPPKMPPQVAGAKGKTGKLGAAPAKQAVVKKPPGTEGYAPYKKFSPDAAVTGASDLQSQGNVKGDVLHWARQSRHY